MRLGLGLRRLMARLDPKAIPTGMIALLFMMLTPPCFASGMERVPESEDFCDRIADRSAICYEWSFHSDPGTRFVAHGYEDGIDYSFYRLSADGSYEHIVRVFPVLRDDSGTDALFLGYPWDIQDTAIPDNGNAGEILATFEHTIIDDGEIRSPDWQKAVPAVLFLGRTTQPAMKVDALQFAPRSLSSLRSGARR